MSEELGSDLVVISDEDGNDIELELLDALEYEGETYMAFIPAEVDDEQEEVDFFILRVEEDDEGEELLVTIDDEKKLEKIYTLFMEKMENLEEE